MKFLSVWLWTCLFPSPGPDLHQEDRLAAASGGPGRVVDEGPASPRELRHVHSGQEGKCGKGHRVGPRDLRSHHQAHGGRIWAENANPHGAALNLYYSRSDAEGRAIDIALHRCASRPWAFDDVTTRRSNHPWVQWDRIPETSRRLQTRFGPPAESVGRQETGRVRAGVKTGSIGGSGVSTSPSL